MLKSKGLFVLIGMFVASLIYGQHVEQLHVDSIQIEKIRSDLDRDSDNLTLENIDVLKMAKKDTSSSINNQNRCGNGIPRNQKNINHKPSKTERIIGIFGSLISVSVFARLFLKNRK